MVDARRFALSGAAALCSKLARNMAAQQILFNAFRINRSEARAILLNEDLRFIAYCLARRDWSRSQIMQDLWVCFELGEKTGGYFVEFGATNGLSNSNTWLLEKKLGWKGILAEPNPLWHSDLAANRTSCIERKCVCATSGGIVPFITTNNTDPELSAMADFSGGDHFALTRSQGKRIQVETISLDDLLEKYEAPPSIDYLSIDTEGSEFEILSSYSFRHRFKTISVETNKTTDDKIHRILVARGYRRVFKQFSQWDSWYVSKELRDGRTISIVAPDT